MTNPRVDRDERTISVENAGYRWAFMFLSYGLLVSVALRSFLRHEQPWDLLALVVAGGAVATLYQRRHRVLTRSWVVLTIGAVVAAVLLAATLVLLRRVS